MRLTKIEKMEDDNEDAIFLEYMMLQERALLLLDDVFKQFVDIRLDKGLWDKEIIEINKWIEEN